MGKLVNAGKLLGAIENAGSEMKLPNVYVAPLQDVVIELSRFFMNLKALECSCTIEDTKVATAILNGTELIVSGVAEGFTSLNVTIDGEVHTVNVTVRNSANSNGWM